MGKSVFFCPKDMFMGKPKGQTMRKSGTHCGFKVFNWSGVIPAFWLCYVIRVRTRSTGSMTVPARRLRTARTKSQRVRQGCAYNAMGSSSTSHNDDRTFPKERNLFLPAHILSWTSLTWLTSWERSLESSNIFSRSYSWTVGKLYFK